MNFSQDILMVLLISVVANATNTELANNSNILLILLLAMYGNNNQNTCNCGCNRNLFNVWKIHKPWLPKDSKTALFGYIFITIYHKY